MPLWAHPTSRSIPKDAPAFVLPGREGAAVSPLRAVHPQGIPPARTTRPQEIPPFRTTRPPGIPPFRTTRPLETPPRPHDTPAGNFSHRHDTSAGDSPSRTTHESLPSARHALSAPDSADAAEGRFTASFCRFTDRADSPLPEQPCSIWDFSYLCTLPSHEPHFSSP